MKGQSYTAQPNIKRVSFQDSWGWAENQGTQFLDATVMLFDNAANFVEFFDFARTTSTSIKSIRHSGDVLNQATRTGRHKVEIDLSALPVRITTLVFFSVELYYYTPDHRSAMGSIHRR